MNNVWSSNSSLRGYRPNAFTDKAIMIPLRFKEDALHSWQQEKVNVKTDYLQHFDYLPMRIEGIAIMTDTDNSNGSAIASYGDIYFSSN